MPPLQLRTPRVLVVDDDDGIRELVSLALLDDGFEVITAANGAIALDRVTEYPPDVIILDMNMPVVDGWQFASGYRSTVGQHAPILVFTAGQSAAACAKEIGADGFIGKPFDLDHLVGLVRQCADLATPDR